MTRILLISQDKQLKETINSYLKNYGYDIMLEDFVESDLKQIIRISPDLIIVDTDSSAKDSLEICRLVR